MGTTALSRIKRLERTLDQLEAAKADGLLTWWMQDTLGRRYQLHLPPGQRPKAGARIIQAPSVAEWKAGSK